VPLYEYGCPKCGHTFDVIQKFDDPPTVPCPECGAKAKRKVSSPAIQFKGSGFYITDYTGKGKPPPEKSGATSGAKGSTPAPAKKKKKKKKTKDAG